MAEQSNQCRWPVCGQAAVQDLQRFEQQCRLMQPLGYDAVMVDVLVDVETEANPFPSRDTVFADAQERIVYTETSFRQRIKQIASANGLAVPSCHFIQTLQPAGEEPDWIFARHERLLDEVVEMGASFVTTHLGWAFGEQSATLMGDMVEQLHNGVLHRDDYLRKYIQRRGGLDAVVDDSIVIYRHLCQASRKRGFRVTIETVPSPLGTACCAGILALIEKIGMDNLGICLDAGHCHACGLDVAREVKTGRDKIWETHFHDNIGPQSTWPQSDQHLPIGKGTIDWAATIAALQEIDYRGYITFEQADYQTNIQMWKTLTADARYRIAQDEVQES